MEVKSAKKEINKFGDKVRSRLTTDKGEEGDYTKAIEQQTEKLPSGLFLTAGAGVVATTLILKSLGMHKTANFVGLWTPTILILGLYNKMVKLHGSERNNQSLESESNQYH